MNHQDGYKKIIRWGFLGCGSVTEVKSGPAYNKVEGFQLAAVMRRDASKVWDYAKRHGVEKYYTNAEELINDKNIDAIYIATPPDSHKFYGLKVAEAGKPCCIEKPLASNYQDSLAICERFKEKNLPLFVAYYRRSLPRFIQVKNWLEEGAIGNINQIKWQLNKPPNSLDLSGQYNWRTDPLIAKGGYFDDLASHGLDLFTYLVGNIKEASGNSYNKLGLYLAKDEINASWLHENGVKGSGSWNFGCKYREDHVEILGSKGTLEFSIFDEAPLILNNDEGRKERFIKNPENIQIHHIENMREHLLGITEHPSNGSSATHTSWVMDKILGTI